MANTALNYDDIQRKVIALRILDLQECLERLGLKKSGRKTELQTRLLSYFEDGCQLIKNGHGPPRDENRLVAGQRIVEEVYYRFMLGGAFGSAAPYPPSTSGTGAAVPYANGSTALGAAAAAPTALANNAMLNTVNRLLGNSAVRTHQLQSSGAGGSTAGSSAAAAGGSGSGQVIRCTCNQITRQGLVQCRARGCGVWQHAVCAGTPQEFYCVLCRAKRADPFYEVEEGFVADPMKLCTTGRQVPVNNTPQAVRSVERQFALTPLQVRKFTNAEGDHQLQLVCLQLNDAVPFRFHWPLGASLKVNDVAYRVYVRNGTQKLGANGRDEQANIGEPCRGGRGRVSMQCTDNSEYVMLVLLVRRRTMEEVRNLMARPYSVRDALARVRQQLRGDDDDEVETGATVVSLRCPITGSRVRTPARFSEVPGLAVFDLEAFLESCQRTRKWQCPISMTHSTVHSLQVDTYMQRILTALAHHPDVMEIEVGQDGSWRPAGWRDRFYSIEEGNPLAGSVGAVAAAAAAAGEGGGGRGGDSDEETDEEEELRRAAQAVAEAVGQKRKRPPSPDVIDLASSDDEDWADGGAAGGGGGAAAPGAAAPNNAHGSGAAGPGPGSAATAARGQAGPHSHPLAAAANGNGRPAATALGSPATGVSSPGTGTGGPLRIILPSRARVASAMMQAGPTAAPHPQQQPAPPSMAAAQRFFEQLAARSHPQTQPQPHPQHQPPHPQRLGTLASHALPAHGVLPLAQLQLQQQQQQRIPVVRPPVPGGVSGAQPAGGPHAVAPYHSGATAPAPRVAAPSGTVAGAGGQPAGGPMLLPGGGGAPAPAVPMQQPHMQQPYAQQPQQQQVLQGLHLEPHPHPQAQLQAPAPAAATNGPIAAQFPASHPLQPQIWPHPQPLPQSQPQVQQHTAPALAAPAVYSYQMPLQGGQQLQPHHSHNRQHVGPAGAGVPAGPPATAAPVQSGGGSATAAPPQQRHGVLPGGGAPPPIGGAGVGAAGAAAAQVARGSAASRGPTPEPECIELLDDDDDDDG